MYSRRMLIVERWSKSRVRMCRSTADQDAEMTDLFGLEFEELENAGLEIDRPN